MKPYNANPQTLGEHFRKKRIESDLLQKDVAELIRVSEDTITYWENGRAIPQMQHYPLIIAFLGYYPFNHETETIAGKIKQLRYYHGLSYEQCGDLFSVNASTVRAWELGQNRPARSKRSLIREQWNSLSKFVKIQP